MLTVRQVLPKIRVVGCNPISTRLPVHAAAAVDIDAACELLDHPPESMSVMVPDRQVQEWHGKGGRFDHRRPIVIHPIRHSLGFVGPSVFKECARSGARSFVLVGFDGVLDHRTRSGKPGNTADHERNVGHMRVVAEEFSVSSWLVHPSPEPHPLEDQVGARRWRGSVPELARHLARAERTKERAGA